MSRLCGLGRDDHDRHLEPPDEGPNRCVDCSVVEDWSSGGVEELCSNARCPDCCEEHTECHIDCSIAECKRRVLYHEVCRCCGRCYRHDCKREEDADRRMLAAEAKGDEMRDELAIGGAL